MLSAPLLTEPNHTPPPETGSTVRVSTTTHRISVSGKMRDVPALQVEGVVVTINGGFVRVGKIFDAYWLEAARLPDPRRVVQQLKTADTRPDLFTFTQRAPETTPRFDFHLDWDNIAAIPVSSHGHWFQKQISAASRRNVRTSEKKGVTVRSSPFDERYIRGIMAISDESPVRAGRQYWHYGKDFATVEAEQGTYRERSTYLGAYLGDEQIGYLKMVWDTHSAAIMQIVSKMEHRDKRTNNALLSEAVRLCAEREVPHLLYERFVYGDKVDSSLTRFKRENGFVRMDVPCYFVPLTAKGRMALSLGLHKSLKDRLPQWVTGPLLQLRDKWYARRFAGQ
jgi:hypothetical protein